ncbi:MAG: methionine--tRNA ligase [Patescibacteria group bacterium]|jgi:methionyl-tRNA synthetase
MSNKFYITTSLPYINSHPHIGHALELVQADVIARWQRLHGREVFFLTGTDEHGSKIAKVAKEAGQTPGAVAERNSSLFSELREILNLSNDDFIRTSDRDRHWPGAQELWRKLSDNGDIYKDTYHGLYCVGCEAFITEKELVNGCCPIHLKEPEAIEEDNYFFRLSKYAAPLIKAIKSGEFKIIPENRATEIINVMEAGLTDISFSRPADKLPWGIPVPDDPAHTMYVWCDALSNYITGIGFGRDEVLFKKWWPADLQVVGKDILRFHAAIFPAMLLSAKLPLPKVLFVHGFITSGGHKMSKSLGNVIDPTEIVDKYGADAARYYLLKEIPTTDDGDFSWRRFEEVYNSELANNLGNLVSRVLQMAAKFAGGAVPPVAAELPQLSSLLSSIDRFEGYDFARVLTAIDNFTTSLNILVDETKPWELFKAGKQDEVDRVIYQLLEGLRIDAALLSPFLPGVADVIYEALGLSKPSWRPLNWEDAIQWGQLPAGQVVAQPSILFPKFN